MTDLLTTTDKNKAPVRAYTWGLDASGSMQGAGGVGGLLMANAGSGGVHFPAYDLNGNVMGLVNATNGIISAKYEYGPFGEVFCSVGDMAKVNPFQFSTKYTDNETDLVYYGYRYYSPTLGRWLSRDPIEEQGGFNLYGFVNNDPVNKWDKLGLVYMPVSINESEKKWAKKHPCCAVSARNSGKDIKKEMSVRYPKWKDNTVENAVQHCAWMCYVASMFWCSKEDALELRYAHENYEDNPEHDMAMDLFNNTVGVSVGGTDLASCFDKCEAKAKSYELYWWQPVMPKPPRKNLPIDFPGFTLSPDGRIIGGNIGISSPIAPIFTILSK